MNKRYKLGLYEKAMPNDYGWDSKFMFAKKAGFDYIEMSIDESENKLSRLEWSNEKIHQLVNIANFENMKIGSICLSGHRKYPLGGEDEKTSLDIMEKAINFAFEAGIPVIQLAGYDVYYQESSSITLKRFEKNLRYATNLASQAGVVLGFETMETPFMDTVEKAMNYVNKMQSAYLGVYPDIGNLNNSALAYNHSVSEDLEKGKGHLIALHIKETVPKKYREVPFNTGCVDFNTILNKAWDLGIRRYVTELWYVGNEDWQDRNKEASSLARNILDKLQ
ncbi:MAG: L-ribulose-5-phosphate 3-epimerase [Pleomorphochaeta sp.]